MYLNDNINYINNEIADMTKKRNVTTKVALKTKFSTPLLVNEDELELLPKPVPRTCNNTNIISKNALID